MAADPAEVLEAADNMLGRLEQSKLLSQRELGSIRNDMVRQIRGDMRRGVDRLQTMRVGSARVLVPNSANLERARITSRRVQQRMSAFRLRYLDKETAKAQVRAGTMPQDPGQFIRHSRRLARHTREYLARIGELEPSLQEEIDATLRQIDDNDMDLLKLEIKSMTRAQENLQRMVNGRMRRSDASNVAEAFDLNRGLWNLSLVEHPAASVQELLANASERMAQRVTTTASEVPKRAFVMVGIPPGAEKAMTPRSRVSRFAWRLYSVAELDQVWRNLPTRQSASNWRQLGLDYNTPEWYIPVPPESVEGIKPLLRERRRAVMRRLRAQEGED